jgi:hypothetical protein
VARQGLLRYVAVLGAAIAGGMTTQELFSLVDDELRALEPRKEAFERELRALAEAWLEGQARTLKPRRPRITSGTYRRAAAGDPEALRQLRDREREDAAREARAARRCRPVSA